MTDSPGYQFEPLYIAGYEVTEIQMYPFAQCMEGLNGTAPKRGLMHKRPVTRKRPNGLMIRYCPICGNEHPASLTWCCESTTGQPTMAQFRQAFRQGTLALPMFFTDQLASFIPFLQVGLYSLCLITYPRIVEVMRRVETLVLEMAHLISMFSVFASWRPKDRTPLNIT